MGIKWYILIDKASSLETTDVDEMMDQRQSSDSFFINQVWLTFFYRVLQVLNVDPKEYACAGTSSREQLANNLI